MTEESSPLNSTEAYTSTPERGLACGFLLGFVFGEHIWAFIKGKAFSSFGGSIGHSALVEPKIRAPRLKMDDLRYLNGWLLRRRAQSLEARKAKLAADCGQKKMY